MVKHECVTTFCLELKGFLHSRVLEEDVDLPVLLKELQKILISCGFTSLTVTVSCCRVEGNNVHCFELTTADSLKFHRLQQHTI